MDPDPGDPKTCGSGSGSRSPTLQNRLNCTFPQEVEEQNEEEVEKGLTMEQQFLQLVLQNVRHFISLSGQPAWQLAALGKHSVGFNADSDPTL